MNGTLWYPAAPLRLHLRVAALMMLCLWARPVLGEPAPPADAADTPTRTAAEVPASGSAAAAGAVAAATVEPEVASAPPPSEEASPPDDGLAAAGRAAETDPAEVPAWRPEGIDADEEDVGTSAGAMLLRTVIVLGVVLAAIYLTLNVGLRRLMGLSAVGGRGNSALLQIVERHPVGPRHALLVVRAGEDHLVVGQSEGQMNLISRIEPSQVEAHARAKAESPAAAAPVLSPFLQKLLARRGEPVQSPDPAPPPPTTPPSV